MTKSCLSTSVKIPLPISMGMRLEGPTLLYWKALASTKLNLLLDVGFNREVGEDGAIYWKKMSWHASLRK